MLSEHKIIIQDLIELVWNGGRLAALDEICQPAIRYYSPYAPGTLVGLEGLKQWISTVRTAFPDLIVELDGYLVAEGEQVAGRWTATGTQLYPIGQLPASGRMITISGLGICRFVDDRLAEINIQYDVRSLLQQLGALHELSEPVG